MTWQPVSEHHFRETFYKRLDGVMEEGHPKFDFVTGPGRSGAVAAVYASHYLGLPFIPHKAGNYAKFNHCLIVDTAIYTGKTMRKSFKWHEKQGVKVVPVWAFTEWRHHYYLFWYEYPERIQDALPSS